MLESVRRKMLDLLFRKMGYIGELNKKYWKSLLFNN